MKLEHAKNLHNEDEVTIKETGRILRVLDAYTVDDPDHGECVLIECEDGCTYRHDEVS
jgi:hypothetical protein